MITSFPINPSMTFQQVPPSRDTRSHQGTSPHQVRAQHSKHVPKLVGRSPDHKLPPGCQRAMRSSAWYFEKKPPWQKQTGVKLQLLLEGSTLLSALVRGQSPMPLPKWLGLRYLQHVPSPYPAGSSSARPWATSWPPHVGYLNKASVVSLASQPPNMDMIGYVSKTIDQWLIGVLL